MRYAKIRQFLNQNASQNTEGASVLDLAGIFVGAFAINYQRAF